MKKVIMILFQFLFALSLFGEKPFYSLKDRVQAEEYFLKGIYHYNNMEYQAAVDFFRNAMATMPFYEKVRFWLGKSYWMAGYRQFAANEWEGMTKLNSADILIGQKLQQLYTESFIDKKVSLDSPLVLLRYLYDKPGITALQSDSANRIYISNYVANTLEERDPNFYPVRVFDAGLNKPMDIALEGDAIAVASFGNDLVLIYDKKTGKIIYKIGGFGIGQGQFAGPAGIYLADNILYVADSGNNRIQVFRIFPKPEFMMMFGEKGKEAGNLFRPSDVIFFENKIYVADLGNKRIQVFDESGNFLSQFGDDFLDTPRKLLVQNKKFYVLDEIKGLLEYDFENQKFRTVKANNQDFQKPLGVNFDKNGMITIADFFTNKISSFVPDKMKLSSLRIDSLLTLNTGFPTIAVKMRIQDLKGNDMEGLHGKNFKVFQEGELIKDPNIFPLKPEADKFSMTVLYRNSNSMKKYSKDLQDYFRKITEGLKFNDRIRLMGFNSMAELLLEPTGKKLTIMDALEKIKFEKEPEDGLDYSLYQAISKTMNNEFYNAVLLIDDGNHKSEFKKYNPEVLATYAQKNGVPVFVLAMDDGNNTEQLKYIAEESGGMYLNFYKSNKIYSLFNLVRENQPLFYILTYKSPLFNKINKSHWLNVLIELNFKGLYGADRTGYYIP